MKLPNFFIVGAAKAGTTSLYHYLDQHPDVYMSPVKEPNYFSSDIDVAAFSADYKGRLAESSRCFEGPEIKKTHIAFIREWEQYLRLFQDVRGQKAVGEASGSYLYSTVAAKNIREKLPGARIIIILRDPAERAYSHYLMDLRCGLTSLPFRKALDQDIASTNKGWGRSHLYVELGLYHEQVKRYLEIFPEGQVRIYLYEDLKRTLELVQDVFGFLGVSGDFAPFHAEIHNKASVPRSAKVNSFLKGLPITRKIRRIMPEAVAQGLKNLFISNAAVPRLSVADREYMASFFAEDIERLSKLIRRDLSAWLR